MTLRRSQGITRIGHSPGVHDTGLEFGSAYQTSLDQYRDMGGFNTFGMGNTFGGKGFDIRQDDPRYSYDGDTLREELKVDQVTDTADTLKGYGDQLFAIFDQYQDNFEYLGDNAGVTQDELNNRLGLASSNFQANADAKQAEYERDMRRMGINPNSAKFAGFGTSNALQKAAGMSLAQNEVRENARDESWKENMQVAELGLNAGKSGSDAVGYAANMYGMAGKLYTDNRIKYHQLNEAARQFDHSYAMKQDQLKLGAQNQAYGQAAERYANGLQQNNTYDGMGRLSSSQNGYGY